ncbi:MAG TPA: HigA family addiction module antitoxin [Afifellaceae bacterium]|nr:HigA family addiction module antitoxin [Afifellaceae bacterium]
MNPKLKGLPAVHPGVMLAREVLPHVDLPRAEVSRRLGISRALFYRILSGKAAVTPAVALRLGRLFGTSAEMWLGLQRDYDLAVEAERLAAELQSITPLKAA